MKHPQQTKPPAAKTAPLTAVAMEDDKDTQGGSPLLSPTAKPMSYAKVNDKDNN
jgi:hypothetical protein